jgi:hypothetical protein
MKMSMFFKRVFSKKQLNKEGTDSFVVDKDINKLEEFKEAQKTVEDFKGTCDHSDATASWIDTCSFFYVRCNICGSYGYIKNSYYLKGTFKKVDWQHKENNTNERG